MSTQTQLSTFTFETHAIRTLAINNEPWFVAKDLCDVLGIKNPTQALENLDNDERAMFNIGLDQKDHFDKRISEINIVSESGMYTLMLRSRNAVKKGTPQHRFRKWVTSKVLPQIRKTGRYQAEQIALPEPEPKYSRELTERQWLKLASLWFALYNNLELLGKIYKPLNALGSPYGVTAYTHATEYQTTLGALQRLLVPLLAEFDVDPRQEAHYYRALRTLREYEPKGLGAIVRI